MGMNESLMRPDFEPQIRQLRLVEKMGEVHVDEIAIEATVHARWPPSPRFQRRIRRLQCFVLTCDMSTDMHTLIQALKLHGKRNAQTMRADRRVRALRA